ncbi:glycine cleavage system H protein [Hydrogenivirga caldilitoris]|uniref:Glycine cleavage system H protein n=1 Tax=Hydrogenivirga caldilitoris TaxID=246264 RepID=A0A497XM42_9AQUI|nr:glycine cleavage system protein GcvH [Hydrogenivirga caldilitoris]RLJ69858.1 glycine cleavage system H protein [Hydrogenivirga caldilitoris]
MEDIVVGGYLVKGDRYYTKDHEWALIKNGKAQIGITDYAQKMLGDIVYVDLPEREQEVDAGETVANIESVKNVAPVYSPVTGSVIEVNEDLADEPTLINEDPYDAGWIAVLEMKDPTEVEDLMPAEDYAELLREIIKEEQGEEATEEIPVEGLEESLESLPEEELGYEEER